MKMMKTIRNNYKCIIIIKSIKYINSYFYGWPIGKKNDWIVNTTKTGHTLWLNESMD